MVIDEGGEGFIWCVLYEEEGGVEMLIGWIAREDWSHHLESSVT